MILTSLLRTGPNSPYLVQIAEPKILQTRLENLLCWLQYLLKLNGPDMYFHCSLSSGPKLTGSGGAGKNSFDAKQSCPAKIQPGYCFKMRLSMELTFSAFIGEARSILRDAVEYVAHAHRMLRDPGNVAIWVAKNDGEQEKKKFKEVPATCWQLDLSKPFPA
jgi:hypothetical protein